MEATELQSLDGKPSGIFYCGLCRNVYGRENGKENAEKCCLPKLCEICQAEMDPKDYYVFCGECRDKRDRERVQKLIDEAKKINAVDYDGWVYSEYHMGPQDGYFESIWAFKEFLEDECDEGIGWPEWVFACNEVPFPKLSSDKIIDYYYDQLGEEMVDRLLGLQELDKACAEFWLANKHLISYEQDTKRVVRVPDKTNIDGN